MGKFVRTRVVDLTIATIGMTLIMTDLAWATFAIPMPGPSVALLAGGAIIGTLIVAKWIRRK
jgi:hypothetical protein